MLKRVCQSLGISSLILVTNYGDLLGGGADVRMHRPFPLGSICFAQILDILVLALVLFLALTLFSLLARVTDSRWVRLVLAIGLLQLLDVARVRHLYRWVRLGLAIVLPPYLIQRTQSFFPFDLIEGLVLILLVGWAAFLIILLLRFPRWYRRVMSTGSAVAAALVAFAAVSIAQLLWVARWRPGPHEINAAWESDAANEAPRQHPLIVWVIFDELSYDQIFEHRAADLALPNFDALRRQSTLFTDTKPAGYFTVKIVPSLLTGQVVDGIRYNFHNRLWVHHETPAKWQPIDGAQTVFADADRDGWRTAAVGWYNPYCTIYGDAIQQCYWTNHDMLDGMVTQRASLWRNVYTPLQQMVRELKSPARADRDLCTFDVRERYRTFVDLESHALQVLQTDQADFVFLHLPIPHSPNIWSRKQADYTQYCGSSYLDNLALADRELGRMMTILQGSPRWPETSLIVQGDHSWRIDAWNWLPAWTQEDEAASRGVFDQRPALLIHQAGQNAPATVPQAWPILQVHGVVEQMLSGQPVKF